MLVFCNSQAHANCSVNLSTTHCRPRSTALNGTLPSSPLPPPSQRPALCPPWRAPSVTLPALQALPGLLQPCNLLYHMLPSHARTSWIPVQQLALLSRSHRATPFVLCCSFSRGRVSRAWATVPVVTVPTVPPLTEERPQPILRIASRFSTCHVLTHA